MENFLLGMQALSRSIAFTVLGIWHAPMMWGFIGGFAVSTVIHVSLLADDLRMIPAVFSNDPASSFERMTDRGKSGTYLIAYSAFRALYDRLRLIFYSLLLAILIGIGIVLLTYRP